MLRRLLTAGRTAGCAIAAGAGLLSACVGRPARVDAPAPAPVPAVVMADASAPDALVMAVRPLTAERPVLASAEGEATYYADMFTGRLTASGVVFDNAEPYAAHRDYPFGTVLRITNLTNARQVEVVVVDRGPHGESERQRGTIIDVSRSTAEQLDFVHEGRVRVRVDVLVWGS